MNFQYDSPELPSKKGLHIKKKMLRVESKLIKIRIIETKKGEGSDKYWGVRKSQ